MLALMSPRLARWMQSSQGTLIAPLRWRRKEGEGEAAATGVVGSGVDEEEAMAKRPISDRTVDTWVRLLAIVNVEAVSPESEVLQLHRSRIYESHLWLCVAGQEKAYMPSEDCILNASLLNMQCRRNSSVAVRSPKTSCAHVSLGKQTV